MFPGRNIRMLINPRSGPRPLTLIPRILRTLQEIWDREDTQLTYQFTKSHEDGQEKARRAIQDNVDTVLIAGGDGMVNSIASQLIGTNVALGVIPIGSGNGFARHFGIPLQAHKAVEALFSAKKTSIDIGYANDRPFFVTCSMAWDAAITKTFEKSPVRGILPYVFSAAYEYFDYLPTPLIISIDKKKKITFEKPMIFTIANLTQFGGGAQIAPRACPNDGVMELVVAEKKDTPKILSKLSRLFDGTIGKIKELHTFRFQHLTVQRSCSTPIQIDGERVEADSEIFVRAKREALNILVP